jgi:hypothetical protein
LVITATALDWCKYLITAPACEQYTSCAWTGGGGGVGPTVPALGNCSAVDAGSDDDAVLVSSNCSYLASPPDCSAELSCRWWATGGKGWCESATARCRDIPVVTRWRRCVCALYWTP